MVVLPARLGPGYSRLHKLWKRAHDRLARVSQGEGVCTQCSWGSLQPLRQARAVTHLSR